MLSIQNISYRIAGRSLLDNVSINIPSGHRVGLVGPNGAGKSTLFRLISGEIAADDGVIQLMKNGTLGMVRQDFPDEESSLLNIVLAADEERAVLMEEAETTEDIDRIGYIYERLTEINAYEAPSRAASILAGLGFDEDAQEEPITNFSGGWRARVALACVLFSQPTVLLLDEPTNHLDFESLVWLENFLMRYKGTMVLISHDREILNKVVGHIVHLDNQKLVHYTGTYDQFERTRAERQLNQQALHEKQMAQKAHLMKYVDRFRASATKARQAQSRLKAIERMDIVDAIMAERVTAFRFPQPQEMKSPLVRLDDVNAGYTEGFPVLKNLDLCIDQSDRIALLGANGNGKSTLIKIISDRLAPMAGEVLKSAKLKIGYFAQFQTEELDTTLTPFETMQTAMQEPSEPKVRSALARFGFDRNKVATKVGALSGGEKARLLFCLMSHNAPHILLLDEPTNHLDMDAREALMQALNDYSGAVILVSHDLHLVECVADQLWLVNDGGCKSYDGDLADYKKLVMQQHRHDRKKNKKESKPAVEEVKTEPTIDHEKEAIRLEALIADYEEQKSTVEHDIAKCYAKDADPKKLKRLNQAFDRLAHTQDETEMQLTKIIASL